MKESVNRAFRNNEEYDHGEWPIGVDIISDPKEYALKSIKSLKAKIEAYSNFINLLNQGFIK